MDVPAERRRIPRGPVSAPAAGEDLAAPYDPAPLGDLPLCIPLPPGWHDDPAYQVWPYAYAGCDRPPDQFGVIGTMLRAGELVAMSYAGCFAHAYFGPPGSGKSYLEGVLIGNRYQGRLPRPLCAVALCYGQGGGGHGAELLRSRLPNACPEEVRELVHGHGTLPQGIADVVALVPRRSVAALRQEHPHCQVLALQVAFHELGVRGLRTLMAFGEQDGSLLSAEVDVLLGALPPEARRGDLDQAMADYPFRDRRLRRLVQRRLELAGGLLGDGVGLQALMRPGRLLVVGLSDPWLGPDQAMRIFQVVLDVLVLGKGRPSCGLLLCIDEAHRLLRHRGLRLQIEHIIRERRHLGVSVVLSSQDPEEVPHSTLAELCGVGLFATESERSIRHLARDVAPFAAVRAQDLAELRPGQMMLWSRRWCTPYRPRELAGCLVRVQVRPRLSHHGGATRGRPPPPG